jgi:5'-methylthioadenosine phosphorylase
MTNVPEAFLVREAQLCYCTIAIATDYDCWMDDPEQHASVDKILPLYKQNLGRVQGILNALLTADQSEWGPCSCRESLKYAVVTPDSAVPREKQHILDFLRE